LTLLATKEEPTDVLEVIFAGFANSDSEDDVTANVNLRYMGTESIENVTLSISIPEPIYTENISIVIPSIGITSYL
jgi:hypothetical protein